MSQTTQDLGTANQQALSTPPSIDIGVLVASIAKRKSDGALEAYRGKVGADDLASAVASAYKSLRGIGKQDRLPDEEWQSIKDACRRYWLGHANRLVDYGRVVRVQFDAPSVKFDKDSAKVESIAWRASMVAERDVESKERALFLTMAHKLANKRLEGMKDRLGKYTREELRLQEDRVNSLKAMHDAIASTPAQ